MTKKFAILLLIACLAVGTTGCSTTTTGEGTWEAFCGIRTKQIGKTPAKVELKSSVVDKIVDSLNDGEVSDAE